MASNPCEKCGEPARFKKTSGRRRARGRTKADANHTLCQRCWKAQQAMSRNPASLKDMQRRVDAAVAASPYLGRALDMQEPGQ